MFRRQIASTRNALRVGLALPAIFLTTSCVSLKRYEHLQKQAAAHSVARESTAAELERVKRENAKLQAELGAREQQVESSQKQLAQFELDTHVVTKERDEAEALLTQLREELGRAGSHLRVYSEEKQQLGYALMQAEARVAYLTALEQEVSQRALVLRDLALALGASVANGTAELTVSEGDPLVRMVATRVLNKDGKELAPDGTELLSAVAHVALRYPKSKVVVRELGLSPKLVRLAPARLRVLVAGLVERGLPQGRIRADNDAGARAQSDATADAATPRGKPRIELPSVFEVSVALPHAQPPKVPPPNPAAPKGAEPPVQPAPAPGPPATKPAAPPAPTPAS